MPGGLEWIVIGLVALLLFGKRLPGVARSLGQALHEFKAGINGKVDADAQKDDAPTYQQPPVQTPVQTPPDQLQSANTVNTSNTAADATSAGGQDGPDSK